MSMPVDRINALLNIVKEASGHPTKLSGLVAMAMKELEGHTTDAKKEHDEIIAKEAAEAARKRQAELDKQAKAMREEEGKAKLTSQPQEVKPPAPVARPATDFKPAEEPDDTYTDTGEVKRRDVSEEVANG
jgi:hypothetical protein